MSSIHSLLAAQSVLLQAAAVWCPYCSCISVGVTLETTPPKLAF